MVPPAHGHCKFAYKPSWRLLFALVYQATLYEILLCILQFRKQLHAFIQGGLALQSPLIQALIRLQDRLCESLEWSITIARVQHSTAQHGSNSAAKSADWVLIEAMAFFMPLSSSFDADGERTH